MTVPQLSVNRVISFSFSLSFAIRAPPFTRVSTASTSPLTDNGLSTLYRFPILHSRTPIYATSRCLSPSYASYAPKYAFSMRYDVTCRTASSMCISPCTGSSPLDSLCYVFSLLVWISAAHVFRNIECMNYDTIHLLYEYNIPLYTFQPVFPVTCVMNFAYPEIAA